MPSTGCRAWTPCRPVRPSECPATAPYESCLAGANFPGVLLFQADGQWRVRLSGNQGSGVLRSVTDANCFICLPEDSDSVGPGDLVEVQPFAGTI